VRISGITSVIQNPRQGIFKDMYGMISDEIMDITYDPNTNENNIEPSLILPKIEQSDFQAYNNSIARVINFTLLL
jgi:uncharacterized protein with ACT and thioredoxin-like domain